MPRIDFSLTPGREPMGDAISPRDHTLEDMRHPEKRDGWEADLNCRSISYWGETPHEAVQALINGVAQLVYDGSLDPNDPFAPAARVASRFGRTLFLARSRGQHSPDDEDQSRLGKLYQELYRLLKSPKKELDDEMARLVKKYGPDDVAWTLKVLQDDLR